MPMPAHQKATAHTSEAIMLAMHNPTKHQVRAYLERRSRDPKPPPTPEEIRRQLGWGMSPSGFKLAADRS